MAEISASIVSYGGYEEVVQAAASILRYTSQPVDLYIIDNASPDGTGKKLERTRFEKPVPGAQRGQPGGPSGAGLRAAAAV